MSNVINTELLEQAAQQIDYWEGTPMAKMLERDIETNDLEALQAHLNQARASQFDLEYRPSEVY